MKNIVWNYWENRPGTSLPPHILLCREVLRHQCPQCTIHLVTPANVHQYLPDLDPRIWQITLHNNSQNPIAVRCAFIRAFLLERYGGLYVDADCIALKDYSEAFNITEGYDFFAMRRTSAKSKHISIGFYGSQAGGKIITAYADALRQTLQAKTVFRWGEVGAHLLTPIVDRNLERVFLFREEQIHPIVAEHQYLLTDANLSIQENIPNDALCLMLFHRIFEQKINDVTFSQSTAEDLFLGQSFLSKVLQANYPKIKFDRQFSHERKTRMTSSVVAPPPVFIARRNAPEKLLKRIGHWVPSVELSNDTSVPSQTRPRIATVLEERLYQGMRTEAELMLLTPHNWKYILRYGVPDFLLMESTWITASGHWHMAQHPQAREYQQLIDIIIESKKLGFPTVFWFTKGAEYHEHYKEFLQHFDHVFCADPRETDILHQTGIQAKTLLPCAPNVFYRSQKILRRSHQKKIPVLFDGWADLDRMEKKFPALSAIRDQGLAIIESRYQIFHGRKNLLSQYKDHIWGCVTHKGRQALLQQANCYVSFATSLSTPTTQQWMGLEALAYGMHGLHLGKFSSADPRRGLFKSWESPSEFVDGVEQYAATSLPTASRPNYPSQRTLQVPTFSQRLKELSHPVSLAPLSPEQ